MSYCVRCGVELDASAEECPLCKTLVMDPEKFEYGKLIKTVKSRKGEENSPFPEAKGEVETVNRKDFGILLSMVELASAVTCGLLNAFVFREPLWSLAVIGACLLLWVVMLPVVIFKRMNAFCALFLDGLAVSAYLYMLTFQIGEDGWFFGLGLPITVLVTAAAEAFVLCLNRFPKSFLTVSLYLFTVLGVLCAGLEMMIDWYLTKEICLGWSAVVLTVCAVLDIALVTMLSRRRLRNEVRRRLHF
mgnify:CR=1 FL=1